MDELDRVLEEALAGGATVVVPTARLARHWRLRVARRRAAAGVGAWEAPEILPWDGWLQRLWRRAEDPRALLGPLGAAARWERLIADDLGTAVASDGLAELARQAQRLVRQWQLPTAALRQGGTQDSRRFADWLAEHERRLLDQAELDPEDLGAAVLRLLQQGRLCPEPRLLWLGFVRPTPLAAALAQACEHGGSALTIHAGTTRRGPVVTAAAAEPRDEFAQAAGWIQARLAVQGGEADLGLVVPDLSGRRDEVETTLVRLLAPGAVDACEAGINFSVGRPLVDEPVIAAALGLLSGLPPAASLEFSAASLVLRSPAIAGADAERGARARLERRLREGDFLRLDFPRVLLEARRAGDCPLLTGALAGLVEEVASWPARAGTGSWGGRVDRALRITGWPGAVTVGSRVFQVLAGWREVLAELAAEESSLGPLRWRAYLALLARQLRRRQFQPRLPEGRLEVIGSLEAAGRSYSGLWITGLTAERWPPPLRPHPLLPLALQRRHALPMADPAAAAQEAEALLGSLCAAAPEVVLSHAARSGHSEHLPAPALQGLPSLSPVPQPCSWALQQQRAAPSVELHADPAPPLQQDESRRWPVGMLARQLECPMLAFAHDRLSARPLETPAPGLSARLRGTLLHRALELFWQAHGADQAWRELTAEALEARLRACIRQALGEHIALDNDLGVAISAVEEARQLSLLGDLIALERQRPPFVVSGLEQRLVLRSAGLEFSGKADRIDQVDEGSLVLDYKSGRSSRSGLLLPQLQLPQLPAYALALQGQASGMGFVSLRNDTLGFAGVGVGASGLSARQWRSLEPEDWQALLAAWAERIDEVAHAFAQGDARIDLDHPEPAAGAFAVFTRVHELPAALEREQADGDP